MSSSLVRGKYVVAKVTGRRDVSLIEDGAVYQQDGRIVSVGKFQDLEHQFTADEVVGSSHHVVVPGFINSHHHIGLTPVQRGASDQALELWFASRLGGKASPEAYYLDTLYSAFEMIESGVTTVQHIHGGVPGSLEEISAAAEAILRAYRDVGMRVSYSFGIMDQNRRAYISDEDLLKQLPARIANELEQALQGETRPLEEHFTLFEELHGKHAQAECTRIQLSPGNLHWCSEQALEMTGDYSRRYDAPMHIHLLETAYQKEYALRRTGTTAVKHLHKLGLLDSRMTLGHSVWSTEEDIEILADTGTHVCHNCSSNLRLRSGVLPLMSYLNRDIPVAIGIDEAGINDDRDMLQEMRMVLNVHRTPGMEEEDVPTPAQVFQMATERGAHTTPFGADIGVLEPGKAADMVLVDWAELSYPYLSEAMPIVDALLYRARCSHVDTVIVAGEPVLRDGKFTRVDKAGVLAELAGSLNPAPSPEEQRQRQISAELLLELKKLYEGYLDEARTDPFYHANSRI